MFHLITTASSGNPDYNGDCDYMAIEIDRTTIQEWIDAMIHFNRVVAQEPCVKGLGYPLYLECFYGNTDWFASYTDKLPEDQQPEEVLESMDRVWSGFDGDGSVFVAQDFDLKEEAVQRTDLRTVHIGTDVVLFEAAVKNTDTFIKSRTITHADLAAILKVLPE